MTLIAYPSVAPLDSALARLQAPRSLVTKLSTGPPHHEFRSLVPFKSTIDSIQPPAHQQTKVSPLGILCNVANQGVALNKWSASPVEVKDDALSTKRRKTVGSPGPLKKRKIIPQQQSAVVSLDAVLHMKGGFLSFSNTLQTLPPQVPKSYKTIARILQAKHTDFCSISYG
jgi:hypothetical protein